MKRQHAQVRSMVAAFLLAVGAACSNELPVAPGESLAMYKVSGDRQIGIAGEELPRELQIQVRTSAGPVFDAAISIEVTGGGTAAPETVRTDGRGNALIRWTLGETGGLNTLVIRVAGADPQTFTATGVAVDVDDRYYHTNPFGEQLILGLNDGGQFIAIYPNSCSTEGTYQISDSQIAFQVKSATPVYCSALPTSTGLMEEGDIVFEVMEYDHTWEVFTLVQRLVYSRLAPPAPSPALPLPAPPQGDPVPAPSTPGPFIGAEHIYLAAANGPITAPLVAGSSPAWSPDGRRIAFHRDGEVRVINVDGSNEIGLARGAHPTWSPDATQIVFTSAEGISVMNADGSSVRTVVRHDFRDDTYEPWDNGVGQPTWSPDGTRIAFLHRGDGDMMPAQAFVTSSDGSNRYLLTRLEGMKYAESDPSWSPDGSKIVYWSYGYGIAVIDSEGGVPTAVYRDFPAVAYGSKPVWSPDGKNLAFNKGQNWASGSAIWIMSATGSGARLLIPDAYDAAWSPDGATIAFVRARN